MKPIAFFSSNLVIAAILLTAFVGCSDDQLMPSSEPQSSQGTTYLVEKKTEPLIREMEGIERIANTADGGLGYWTEGAFVELPAGSFDALADAIAAAGSGGIVLVRSGMHTESDGVAITNGVRIVGESGAILQIASDSYSAYPTTFDPALHVVGATGRVVVWGLEIIPQGEVGGIALLLEDSPDVVVGKNTIRDFEMGIYVQHADNARIYGNTIESTTLWQTGEVADGGGITVANGENVSMMKNDFSLAIFNVWICGTTGLYMKNSTHDGYIGVILCKVPEGVYFLPNGESAASQQSGNGFLLAENSSTTNFAEGYLVIDGANNNLLLNNRASSNGTYDIELAGDFYRFGFLTPACFENVAIVGSNSVVIKNCGNDNTVVGGSLVDNELDPCY